MNQQDGRAAGGRGCEGFCVLSVDTGAKVVVWGGSDDIRKALASF